jgi:hypothetical protein
MPDDEKMSDTSKFFNTEGRKILTASLIAFYHTKMDFIPICEKIVGSSWKDLFNDIDATENDKAMCKFSRSLLIAHPLLFPPSLKLRRDRSVFAKATPRQAGKVK